jgi:hypothetical protein
MWKMPPCKAFTFSSNGIPDDAELVSANLADGVLEFVFSSQQIDFIQPGQAIPPYPLGGCWIADWSLLADPPANTIQT